MNDAIPLPAQFDPAKTALTGIEVLRHGLPPLPAVLTRQMSVPVAFWTAAHSGVVLFLQYQPHPFRGAPSRRTARHPAPPHARQSCLQVRAVTPAPHALSNTIPCRI